MKKLITILFLIVVFTFAIVSVRLCHDISQSKLNSVLIEGTKSTMFGEGFIIGTGVKLDKYGMILTAKHCVSEVNDLTVTMDGITYNINPEMIRVDKDSDIAVILLNVKVNHFATLGESDSLSYGSIVYSIGNSQGVWDNICNLGWVVKNNYHRRFLGESEYLMLSLDAKSGCSGGGIYSWGKLIGIVNSGIGDNEHITFSVTENEIRKFLNEVRNEQFKELEKTIKWLD